MFQHYSTLLFLGVALIFLPYGQTIEAHWSVCSGYYTGDCKNGQASDDCTFENLQPTGVSVKGLWIFFSSGRTEGPDSSGLAEFLFQERLGDYHLLTETSANISCLKRMGGDDYRTPAITLVRELSLIHDSASRYFETSGSVNNCGTLYPSSVKSLAINGAERWELFGSDGTSVCVQVEDTTSFIPGIVRDIRTLGLSFGEGNICAVVRGCSKLPAEVIRVPNNETSGVLRR
ncbi:unnamed protein product [Orchesella dallaii]|uniref:Uncharacterized protein n=1 Tax=Orchesella dallaii TaxID=48710 RepID=A0ABP1Q3B4_9HEXA